jgi:hypothetical protein
VRVIKHLEADAHLSGYDVLAGFTHQFGFDYPHLLCCHPSHADGLGAALAKKKFVVLPAGPGAAIDASTSARFAGNAASLRFDAIQQRGSRDNDYLTAASHADIGRLMDAFAERFKALDPLFKPDVYEPENPTDELNMITHLVPVALLLNHGKATNNTVKVEFHFEPDLPPAETVSGNVGPTRRTIRARMPELANADARSLPLELHDFVWEVLSNGTTPLAERVANAYTTLSSA